MFVAGKKELEINRDMALLVLLALIVSLILMGCGGGGQGRSRSGRVDWNSFDYRTSTQRDNDADYVQPVTDEECFTDSTTSRVFCE